MATRSRMLRLLTLCPALLVIALAVGPRVAWAEPTVTLEPASGPPGTPASVEGRGFGSRKSVTVRLGRRSLARIRTTSRGSFQGSFKAPAVRPGLLKVVSSNERGQVANSFEVSSHASAGNTGEVASRAGARLRWTPKISAGYVQLEGFGFPARRDVHVQLGGASFEGARANRRKRLSIRLPIPSGAAARHRVRVRAGSIVLAFQFNVTPAPPALSPETAVAVGPSSLPSPDPIAAPAPPPAPQPSLPIRAAFYYAWFPEAWNQNGIDPFTNYHPSLGRYNSDDEAVRRSHLRSLQYAGFEAGIYSWWGQTHSTNARFPAMLRDTNASGSPIKWTLYHEREGYADPSVAEIGSDLDYIKATFASDPAYLRVDGKPVIFVYAGGADGCQMADRWVQANTADRGFYVVLKVFQSYRACTSQPKSWHQYAPSRRSDQQRGYSFAISPEFDLTGPEPPRLARDLAEFQRVAGDMVASGEPWQLVISFNEWGENTATEEAQEWASPSGNGQYLDVLAGL